ncbi:MAG: pseudouridine synthase [Gammaproteobacteria bacterium]|nr:pseudouridine synthase [Gammaproteobacteria bacterium]
MTDDARETLPILYRDERLVVVDKPSGLLVHRSPIDRHETRFALQLLRDQLGQRVYTIHRLDKGTSGVLAFGLDPDTAREYSALFAQREVVKTYVALVRGWPEAEGVIERPLAAVEDERSGPQDMRPRAAQTAYRRIATFELPVRVDRYPTSRYALVELNPHTGRRHQLRRHLSGASHPIVGDSTYGKGIHNRLFRELFGVQRLLLACTRLELPALGERGALRIEAPLAPEFAALLTQLAARSAMQAISPASP